MLQIKSIALATLLGIGSAGLSGHVSAANAESANRANTPAQAEVYAQADRRDLSLGLAQHPAAKSQDINPWSATSGSSGVHFQSRAGFVGYH